MPIRKFRSVEEMKGARPLTPLDPDFEIYRAGMKTMSDWFEARRGAMNDALVAITSAGVSPADLQLAWSFTTASAENTAGRMLHIRDDALASLGDVAPAYTITAVTPNSDDNIALQVEGGAGSPQGTGLDGARLKRADRKRTGRTCAYHLRCKVADLAGGHGGYASAGLASKVLALSRGGRPEHPGAQCSSSPLPRFDPTR